MLLPYSLWMMQRPLNYYHALEEQEKLSVDTYLKTIGAYDAMQFQSPVEVCRKNNRFVICPNTPHE